HTANTGSGAPAGYGSGYCPDYTAPLPDNPNSGRIRSAGPWTLLSGWLPAKRVRPDPPIFLSRGADHASAPRYRVSSNGTENRNKVSEQQRKESWCLNRRGGVLEHPGI